MMIRLVLGSLIALAISPAAFADTCQFNSQRPMFCTITYSGSGEIGRKMTIRWVDGVVQTYRQMTNGGNGGGGRFYIYSDKYGGEWLWGMPSLNSRFGLHNSKNGNSIYFW